MRSTTSSIVPGVYRIALGPSIMGVNVYLLETEVGFALIDTGPPGSEEAILNAARELRCSPHDIRQIFVTHCHFDHAGSLAALKQATGAAAAMHPLDAAMVERGDVLRPFEPAPGILPALLCRLAPILPLPRKVTPAIVERRLVNGKLLANGLRVLYAPGHTVGQVVFHLPATNGRPSILFAADTAGNVPGGLLPPLHENATQALRTLAQISILDFDIACFGHGRPIIGDAASHFRRKWA